EGEAEALTRKAIELALGGDVNALRLCMERLLPPRRDRPVPFTMPPIESERDVQRAIGAILVALADGEMSPSEATAVMNLVDAYRRSTEDPSPSQVMIQVNFVGPENSGSLACIEHKQGEFPT